jgi:hypothetical protein
MNPNLEYMRFDNRAALDAWCNLHPWFRPLEIVFRDAAYYVAVDWKRQ